jgi:hypothetical protein
MNLQLLRHACETPDGPLSAEVASQLISKWSGQYASTRDALGEMEILRLAGLMTYCAPDEFVHRSAYPYMRPTPAGRQLAKQTAPTLDELAHQMWICSSP